MPLRRACILQFTCFTSLLVHKVQVLTQQRMHSGAECAAATRVYLRAGGGRRDRYAVYLLYWNKSAKTDAAAGVTASLTPPALQFTCFTGTKVQRLTLLLA